MSSPAHLEPVPNDPYIRKLTILSQLAVFKDIIPGYRIRELTDKEKAEKVSQMVTRTREWEQGLVSAYQSYLKCLDSELKGRRSISHAFPETCSCPPFCSKIWFGRRSLTMFMYPSRRGHSLQFPRQYYECHRGSAKQEVVGRGAVILLVVHVVDVVRTPLSHRHQIFAWTVSSRCSVQTRQVFHRSRSCGF